MNYAVCARIEYHHTVCCYLSHGWSITWTDYETVFVFIRTPVCMSVSLSVRTRGLVQWERVLRVNPFLYYVSKNCPKWVWMRGTFQPKQRSHEIAISRAHRTGLIIMSLARKMKPVNEDVVGGPKQWNKSKMADATLSWRYTNGCISAIPWTICTKSGLQIDVDGHTGVTEGINNTFWKFKTSVAAILNLGIRLHIGRQWRLVHQICCTDRYCRRAYRKVKGAHQYILSVKFKTVAILIKKN